MVSMKRRNELTEYLERHAEEERASFHMPGHKGMAFFERLGLRDAVSCAADFDVTEIPGADDLRKSEGVIKAVSDKYSRLYGSRRSFLSVNGSSALIMAAIKTCTRPGHKIIVASDSHISVSNGIKIAGAEAVFVEPESLRLEDKAGESNEAGGSGYLDAPGTIKSSRQQGLTIPGGVSPAVIEEALSQNENIDAVIFPSPNYFGVTSDISGIAEVVHEKGKILIVDQAHGAHLKMFSGLLQEDDDFTMPRPAEECGADIVIDSTHKTMASFTQTAVGHVFGDRVDPNEYEQNLLMFESTSPSYVLMNSLAVNADIMEEHGAELAEEWKENLKYFYEQAEDIDGIRVLTRDVVRAASEAASDFDETKIVTDFSGVGMSGEQAEKILIEKGIYPEFHSGDVVMFLTGIGNVRADYELLAEALRDMK